jgi:sugar transferase (PEP-CTERM/EpsH1 system associated)
MATAAPLVAHVVYRFDTGGLENGVVNLLNHLPTSAFRHQVIALTDVNPTFAARVRRPDVEFISLQQPPGHGWRSYRKLLRLFRAHRPAIVHTRNLAALEAQVPAALAGVPLRVHGEHGRDIGDLRGDSRKYQWVRRMYSPFVHRYIALSKDLERYLVDRVGIAAGRISQVYNGVDADRFHVVAGAPRRPAGCPFDDLGLFLVGTVGRMQQVKAQTLLAEAFVQALRGSPGLAGRLRLVLVGDGPLRLQAKAVLDGAGFGHLAWLPGERADVPEVMRGLDLFVLPSLAEGISNTILEAMASGLPVVATDVGGNAELVRDGHSGLVVPSGDPAPLAHAIIALATDPDRAVAMGRAGRAEVERRFSLQAMVQAYQALYEQVLAAR